MADPQVHDLFAQAGLSLPALAAPLVVGLVPPAGAAPDAWEVDLEPSHHVRLRFKPAGEVGAGAPQDRTCVLAAITWFVDAQAPGGFAGSLPHGLDSAATPDEARQRIGRPPTEQDMADPADAGYLAWYDARPALHLLFSAAPRRLMRVNVFLRP